MKIIEINQVLEFIIDGANDQDTNSYTYIKETKAGQDVYYDFQAHKFNDSLKTALLEVLNELDIKYIEIAHSDAFSGVFKEEIIRITPSELDKIDNAKFTKFLTFKTIEKKIITTLKEEIASINEYKGSIWKDYGIQSIEHYSKQLNVYNNQYGIKFSVDKKEASELLTGTFETVLYRTEIRNPYLKTNLLCRSTTGLIVYKSEKKLSTVTIPIYELLCYEKAEPYYTYTELTDPKGVTRLLQKMFYRLRLIKTANFELGQSYVPEIKNKLSSQNINHIDIENITYQYNPREGKYYLNIQTPAIHKVAPLLKKALDKKYRITCKFSKLNNKTQILNIPIYKIAYNPTRQTYYEEVILSTKNLIENLTENIYTFTGMQNKIKLLIQIYLDAIEYKLQASLYKVLFNMSVGYSSDNKTYYLKFSDTTYYRFIAPLNVRLECSQSQINYKFKERGNNVIFIPIYKIKLNEQFSYEEHRILNETQSKELITCLADLADPLENDISNKQNKNARKCPDSFFSGGGRTSSRGLGAIEIDLNKIDRDPDFFKAKNL